MTQLEPSAIHSKQLAADSWVYSRWANFKVWIKQNLLCNLMQGIYNYAMQNESCMHSRWLCKTSTDTWLCQGDVVHLSVNSLTLEIRKFRCIWGDMDESEKAGSHQALNPRHLACVASAAVYSHSPFPITDWPFPFLSLTRPYLCQIKSVGCTTTDCVTLLTAHAVPYWSLYFNMEDYQIIKKR